MSNVFAMIIINVADTVEKPVAMMAASFVVYFPSLYTRFVINKANE